MKQLFVVTVSAETVVVAEDELEASKLARERIRDFGISDFGADAAPFLSLPDGWEMDDIPHGDVEHTIAEWIEKGAAEPYQRLKARFAARQAKGGT